MSETIGTRDFFFYLVPGSMVTASLILLYDILFQEFELIQLMSLNLTESSFWIFVVTLAFLSYFFGHVIIWPLGRILKEKKSIISREVITQRKYLIEPLCAFWNISRKELLDGEKPLKLQRIYRWTYRIVLQKAPQQIAEQLHRNYSLRAFHRHMTFGTLIFGVSSFGWGFYQNNLISFYLIPCFFLSCSILFFKRQKNSDTQRKKLVFDQFYVIWLTELSLDVS